jgi:hypothetical protein
MKTFNDQLRGFEDWWERRRNMDEEERERESEQDEEPDSCSTIPKRTEVNKDGDY